MPKQEIEIAVCALQRSGHHAVMAWIQSLLRARFGAGSVFYANWVNEFSPQLDPFNTRTQPTDDSHKWLPKDRGCERQALIYNFEDCGLHMLRAEQMYSRYFNGSSSRRFNVVIIRDFYNLVASRMERTRTKGEPFSNPYMTLAGMWLEYADAHEGRYGYSFLDNLVVINYNRWFTDEGYRRKLADVFECPYTEETLDRVHLAGGGSSFTGMDGRGRELKVLERWQKFQDDKEYISVVDRPDIQRVSDEVFGWCLGNIDGDLKVVRYKNGD